jgi:hypothetical protein
MVVTIFSNHLRCGPAGGDGRGHGLELCHAAGQFHQPSAMATPRDPGHHDAHTEVDLPAPARRLSQLAVGVAGQQSGKLGCCRLATRLTVAGKRSNGAKPVPVSAPDSPASQSATANIVSVCSVAVRSWNSVSFRFVWDLRPGCAVECRSVALARPLPQIPHSRPTHAVVAMQPCPQLLLSIAALGGLGALKFVGFA